MRVGKERKSSYIFQMQILFLKYYQFLFSNVNANANSKYMQFQLQSFFPGL